MTPHLPTANTTWRDAVGPGYQFAVTTDRLFGRAPAITRAPMRVTRR